MPAPPGAAIYTWKMNDDYDVIDVYEQSKRSKAPSHYRYLVWVLDYIPYMGLAVFSSAISRVPVYTAISNF